MEHKPYSKDFNADFDSAYSGMSADFMLLRSVNKIEVVDKMPDELKLPITNCVNCGAPVHNHKCEYCKTEY
jgi:hypothetical protein